MADMDNRGQCLCGRIRFHAAGPPVHANHCHCLDCQKQSGAAMMSWVTVRKANLIFDEDDPAYYHSSDRARRGFCPSCGSTVIWESLDDTGLVDVAAGLLESPADLEFAEHLFCDRRRPWLEAADALPKYSTWAPRHEQANAD